MDPSQLTLLDLPAALLGRVLNGRALSNADRVNAMCACRALRDGDVVEFRDIVLRSSHALEAALAAARGRCETLNHVGLDDDGGNVVHVTASTLADVARRARSSSRACAQRACGGRTRARRRRSRSPRSTPSSW